MKKQLLIFVMMLTTVNSLAVEVKINGLWYELISKTNNAKVIHYRDGVKYSGNIVVPETIEYDGIIYNVTIIADQAFSYSSGLTSVTIPNSIISIETEAFDDCI